MTPDDWRRVGIACLMTGALGGAFPTPYLSWLWVTVWGITVVGGWCWQLARQLEKDRCPPPSLLKDFPDDTACEYTSVR